MSLLNKKQQVLCDFMSELSEEAFYAGWMEDLEYVLWYTIINGPINYGHKFIDEQIILQLRSMSEEAESWIIFDDDTWETAVPLLVWQKIFQSAEPDRYLRYCRK